MILMDLQLDNLRGFRNFHLCTACPKEADGTVTFDEHLSGRPDFRYRKTVLILGSNGAGKTAIGLMLRNIFGFICRKDAACLAGDITDRGRPAVCQIDFVPDGSHDLYRMRAVLTAPKDGTIASDGIQATVTHVPIRADDSYETCIARLDEAPDRDKPWTAALDHVPPCSWYLARDSHAVPKGSDGTDEEDAYILETVLSSIDLPWPLQSFLFLKRDTQHPDRPVSCLWASDVLPHETDSLLHTSDRNRFSSSPPLDKVYALTAMASGNKDGHRTIDFDRYGYKTERGQRVDEYMRKMRDNDRI